VVVGLDASDIVVGLGTFHCLTQQIPYVWYDDNIRKSLYVLLIITLDHSKNKYLHSAISEESPTCYWISHPDILLINFITFEFLLS
jgi:hypothetical protein